MPTNKKTPTVDAGFVEENGVEQHSSKTPSNNDDSSSKSDGTSNSPGNLIVWSLGIGKKVQPTSEIGLNKTMNLSGAKDSFVSFQIVVRAKGKRLKGVRVSKSPLISNSGAKIDSKFIRIFRQWFIDFENTSSYEGQKVHTGVSPVPKNSPTKDSRLPDPLIPLIDPYSGKNLGHPFDVKPNQNQPLWVDIQIPKNQSQGDYKGEIKVQAEGLSPFSIKIFLKVWNLVLPDMRSVQTYFIFRIDALQNYHKGTEECHGGDCYLAWHDYARMIVQRYEEMYHEHRIDTGQKFVRGNVNGCKPPTPGDWSRFDSTVSKYLDGRYWKNGVPSTRVEIPFSPGNRNWGITKDCTTSELATISKAWAKHLKEKGWFEKAIVFALDEPPKSSYSDIIKDSKAIQRVDADWKSKILATISPSRANVKELNPAIGVYCVSLNFYNFGDFTDGTDLLFGRHNWGELFRQNIKLWFYQSNSALPPSPTFSSNTLDGLEPTMSLWGSWYEKASGFLYWAVNHWDPDRDPWGPNISFLLAGDGTLSYPGHHNGTLSGAGSPSEIGLDGPIPSMRLKSARIGFQDWALFKMAEDAGLGEFARKEVSKMYIQMWGCDYPGCPAPLGKFYWKTDEDAMNQIRETIAKAIMKKQP